MHWQSQIRQRSLRVLLITFRMPTGSRRRPHTTLVLPVGEFLTAELMAFGKLRVLPIHPLTVQTVAFPSVSVLRRPPGILRRVACITVTACWAAVATTAIIGPLLRTSTNTPTTCPYASVAMSSLRAAAAGLTAIQSAASKNNYL